MSELSLFSVEDVSLDFENVPTKIVLLRNIQELKIAGYTLGSLQEGREFETPNWIALELVKLGFARFHEESMMNLVALNKIHWRETKLQTGRQISALPKFFYPQIRRYLKILKENSTGDAAVTTEYNSALRLIHDIVDCRLKKIVSLSSSSTQTESVLGCFSQEERILYDLLNSAILEWKSKILKAEVTE
ncbi:MAG: replication factor [Thermoproteota archaeon]|nr:replication factor [Thermoproteota archaeon]